MEDNLKIILKEFEELKGQFVITNMINIERLIGIGDDGEDWYYITFDGKNIHWSSCVGQIMPLKGHLRTEDYDYLIHIAKLNHYDQIDFRASGNKNIFLNAVEEDIAKNYKNDRFLTGLYWDLN